MNPTTTPRINFTNSTQATPNAWPYVPLDSKQGLILFLIALPGTLANIVAFITTWKLIKQQAVAPNYLILALNFTDFYGIVFCTLPTLLCYLFKDWVGGEAMCNFQGVSTMFASLASGIFATVMAVDRLLAVWRPFIYRSHVTVKKTFVTIIVTWLVAMFIAVLPLAGVGDFVRNLTGTFCTVNWFAKSTSNRVYSVFYAIIGITLVFIVVVCNVRIALSMFQRRRKQYNLHGLDSDKKRKENTKSEQNEMQLVKSIAAISVLFIVCWFPFMVSLINQ